MTILDFLRRRHPFGRRHLRKMVRDFEESLWRQESLRSEDVARVHAARLLLQPDPERRLRSVETLAALGHPLAVYGFFDLWQDCSRRWPSSGSERFAGALVSILREITLGAYREALETTLTSLASGEPSELVYLPIRLYTSSSSQAITSRIAAQVLRLSETLDLEIVSDYPAIEASWFKRWFARAKETLSREEVAQRLRKAERALELAAVHREQAGVDRQQAEAAAILINSLKEVRNASCQIGSLPVVKIDAEDGSRILTRTLTPREMIFLEAHHHELRDPRRVLQELDRVKLDETGRRED